MIYNLKDLYLALKKLLEWLSPMRDVRGHLFPANVKSSPLCRSIPRDRHAWIHFQYSCCMAVVRSSFACGRSCSVDSGCRVTMKMHGCAQSTSSTYWFLSETSAFPSHMQAEQQTAHVTLLWSPSLLCRRTVWWLPQKGKSFWLIQWSVLADSDLGLGFNMIVFIK